MNAKHFIFIFCTPVLVDWEGSDLFKLGLTIIKKKCGPSAFLVEDAWPRTHVVMFM